MDRLSGLTCLVTGSTGIAAASAELFAAEGARVFVVSRTEGHCRELVERLRKGGAEAAWHAGDLAEPETAEAAVAACRDTFGRIDSVFNVAGGSGRRFGDGPVHQATGPGWDYTLALNGRSFFLGCGAAVRAMLDQEPRSSAGGGPPIRGAVLNMSSALALHPSPAHFPTHAYAAAKGAIVSASRAMAAYYAPYGIRVNVVAPSITMTPMAARAASDPATLAYATWKQPLAGGFLDPFDVARAALFLLSDDAARITGQVLEVDGGFGLLDEAWEGLR